MGVLTSVQDWAVAKENRPAVVAAGIVSGVSLAGLCAVAYFGPSNTIPAIQSLVGLGPAGKQKGDDLSRAELIRILRRLTIGFYGKCREFSEMAKSVRVNLAGKGLNLSAQELKLQLKEQGGVIQKLEAVQRKVLELENVEESKLIEAQQLYQDDRELQTILRGFEEMLDDSLSGRIPILAWIKEPTISQQELYVTIHKLHELEVAHVCARFADAGGILRSVQELGKALASASNEAEAVILQELCMSSEEYYSNVGLHCKADDGFRAERENIEREHRNKMVKMFKPAAVVPGAPGAGVPSAAAVPAADNGAPAAAGGGAAANAAEEKK